MVNPSLLWDYLLGEPNWLLIPVAICQIVSKPDTPRIKLIRVVNLTHFPMPHRHATTDFIVVLTIKVGQTLVCYLIVQQDVLRGTYQPKTGFMFHVEHAPFCGIAQTVEPSLK